MNDKPTENVVNNLPIITKFIYSIGVLPASYKMSMSYEEQVVWLCNYLETTIIPAVNQNGEAVEELQSLYELLRTYVNDYFDNLDVQEEINNKIDSLVSDGTITNLIKNYVDPIQETFENEVDTKINNQDILISQINDKVNTAVSGSPLKATSTSEMTDTTRIYVNTTDGKWYYYDGDSWEIGGTYQSTELGNNSVKYIKLNNNVAGNQFTYDGTSTYPTIIFEIDNLYEGTDENPVSIKLKYKYKHLNNSPANIAFSGCVVNKTAHTITSTYRTNSGQVSTRCYNFEEIEQTINFTHSINAFGICLNTNQSADYEFIVKDIELFINNEKVGFNYVSDYATNANVTVNTKQLNYLSTKEYVDEELNKSIKLFNKLDNKLFSNKFIYNNTGSYPTLYFLLPKFFLNNEPIKIEFDNEIIEDLRNVNLLIRYGSYNVFASTAATSYDYNSSIILYNNFNEKITIQFTPSQTYNYIAIRLNQSASQKYNLLIKNVKIYINNVLTEFEMLSNLSTNWVEETITSTYLLNEKQITDLINSTKTMQDFDSIDKSNKYKIACWGDSLTEGGTNSGQPYPRVLQEMLGDKYTVTNLGKSGQRSGAIAFRQGGVVWKIASGITIPANKTDSVSFDITISDGHPININNGVSFDVSISGIEGKLITSNVSNQTTTLSGTFTRNENGSATSVLADTPILSLQDNYRDNVNIIWTGINDITFAYPFQTLGPINNAIDMVNHLTPSVKRFLIISCTSVASWTPDSQLFSAMQQLNTFYETQFPLQYVDLEDYCVHQLIYDMGLTPTESDLTNMENDIIPASVTADNVHFTGEARVYIAQFIYNELAKRDWI